MPHRVETAAEAAFLPRGLTRRAVHRRRDRGMLIAMQFMKALRERVRQGEIRSTVRIWQSPRVRVGGRYRLAPGHVVVDSILPIDLRDVTGEMARESGFDGIVDLLKVAKHGVGTNVYFITFHYEDA